MSEIEKMYENCGIEIPIARLKIYEDDNGEVFTRPPFTAEKQLELTKCLGEWEYKISIDFHENEWGVATENYSGYFQDFSDALASIINNLWQNLTLEEKQQVKGILE